MKTKVLLLFILIASFKMVAQNDDIDISQLEQKGLQISGKALESGVTNNYNLTYHRCEWQINPAIRYITGKVTTYFIPTDSGFNQIQFDLTDTLTVDSVIYHSSSVSFTQLTNDVLQISFPAVIPMNSLDSVTVYYQGTPARSGFGAFNQTTHAGNPVIWTLSEPLGAKDWWPCKQGLVDKIDSMDVIVTCPQGNRVACNGLLMSETNVDTNVVFHWRTRYPIAAYLVAIGVTNYSYYSNYIPLTGGDTLQVLNYVYPEDLTVAQSQTPEIINIIHFYDSLTIEYPFKKEKYGFCEFGWGGGMEHQTMSFVVNFSPPLIAHETAHQWFGDRVTPGSWQDIWLNEGFATFFEGLTEQRFFPSVWKTWRTSKIVNISSVNNGSVLCDDTTTVSRIFLGRLTYNKGAYLLNMLRWKLGDSIFFLALKNYLNDPLLQYSYVRTTDLIAHLESTSGQDLTSFFNEWFYNQGWPSYQIIWNQKGNAVTMTANQTQSDPSVSFYEMPIPVEFKDATHDTTIVFNHTYSGQVFNFNLNFTADTVKFDPEMHIMSAFNVVTQVPNIPVTLNKVTIYPTPAQNILSVNLQINTTMKLLFEVIDMAGKVMVSQPENVVQGNSTIPINVFQLAKGDYLLNITGTNVNYSQKIAKQ